MPCVRYIESLLINCDSEKMIYGGKMETYKQKNWVLFGVLALAFISLEVYLFRNFSVRPGVFIKRTEIIVLVFGFLSLHCFVDTHKIYDWIYKHRVILCFALFIFFVANCFTWSSVGQWDNYIQPGVGSQYIKPIFGIARPIRSDEWMVSVPRYISAELTKYGPLNDILRATTVSNVSATGLQLDFSIIKSPQLWGHYLLGASYGSSWEWSYNLIFGFLFIFEFCMVTTHGNRLVSFFGACLIAMSSFSMWWSVCRILYLMAAIIALFYYFVREEKTLMRIVFGTILAIMGAEYVSTLYAAWLVPTGWIIVSYMAWILYENHIWERFKAIDWIVFVADILLMVILIVRHLMISAEYLTAILNTVYPGGRVDYGGMALHKILDYVPTVLTPFGGFANPSEMGTIFGVFPLGYFLYIYVLVKYKGKDKLLWFLTPVLTLFTIYCTIGLPPILAKIFMLTFSTSSRTVDFLGVLLAIITVYCISKIQDENGMNIWLSIIVAVLAVAPTVIYEFPKWRGIGIRYYALWIIAVFTVIAFIFILSKNKYQKAAIIIVSCMLFGDGIIVNPISVGLDAITSKPAYGEIQRIVASDPNARWVSIGSFVTPQYLVAAGAHTVNSVNYIPNKDTWERLGVEENEELWNRYAHVVISLIDSDKSEYSVIQADLIQANLTWNDFDKLDIKYIGTTTPIPTFAKDKVIELYNEYGFYIYQVK